LRFCLVADQQRCSGEALFEVKLPSMMIREQRLYGLMRPLTGKRFMFYTEDELNSIWQNLTDMTGYEALDPCALTATIRNTDVKQTLEFHCSGLEIETYRDFDPPSDPPKTFSYTRKRLDKEAAWGQWERNQTYMLDTNVFNDLLDQKISPSLFAGYDVIATGIQLDELKATQRDERRASLIKVFNGVAPVQIPASSFALDIEGAGFGQAYWNDQTGRIEDMLASLQAKDGKHKGKNQLRDVLIAETAIKNGATLITRDSNLRKVVAEFGGRAVSLEEFLSLGMTPSLAESPVD
jgi:predicted nucleic acid-binding protein